MEDEHTIVEYTKDDKGVSGYDPIEDKGMNKALDFNKSIKEESDRRDSLMLAGRSSGKDGSTKAWLNKAEWDKMKAFRHYRETMIWVTGFNPISDEDQTLFDNQYAEIYPDNAKTLNIK